jgi:NAD(P)-dependent dehydrogenase (short-subunit alcohol dehydrogenase family)
MTSEATELLRPGLLDGVTLAVAAAQDRPAGSPARAAQDGPAGSPATAVQDAASGLGAAVAAVALVQGQSAENEEQAAEAAVAEAFERLGALSALVVDCASLFRAPLARDALIACLASAWNAARATATQAFLPAQRGGRIVLLAPASGAEHAAAAAAGLENLARTLSIEWARYGITTVAVAPGEETSPAQLAALTCYLLSPAGAYFSGCLMDLRGPSR